MRILCVGDPHIKYKGLSRCLSMANAIVEVARKEAPDLIVVLGDTLDSFENIKTNAQTVANNMLSQLMEISLTYLLIGNHDYPHPEVFMDADHGFSALHHWGERMVVVDKTISHIIQGKRFTFVPYVTKGRFIEALDREPLWKESEIIFCHQELRGCTYSSRVSEDGDLWATDAPKVIGGHIHDYQRPQDNILYVGAPIQHTFGQEKDRKLALVTLTDGKVDVDRIDLGLPTLRVVKVKVSEIHTVEAHPNELLKIEIHGTAAENMACKKLPVVKAWRKAGYSLSFKDHEDETEVFDFSTQDRSYGDVLFEKIKHDSEMADLYNELFNMIQT